MAHRTRIIQQHPEAEANIVKYQGITNLYFSIVGMFNLIVLHIKQENTPLSFRTTLPIGNILNMVVVQTTASYTCRTSPAADMLSPPPAV